MEKIFTGTSWNAGYENGKYTHEVFRVFYTESNNPPQTLQHTREITPEELNDICPVDCDLESIFSEGKIIVNVHRDIDKGRDVFSEWWECGIPYKSDSWKILTYKSSYDIGWYRKYMYNESKFVKYAESCR